LTAKEAKKLEKTLSFLPGFYGKIPTFQSVKPSQQKTTHHHENSHPLNPNPNPKHHQLSVFCCKPFLLFKEKPKMLRFLRLQLILQLGQLDAILLRLLGGLVPQK